MKTKESDIRIALHNDLEKEFFEDPSTIIIDEMQVCLGDARVDVAVVNGAIHGYEIKSDSDTLERLPQQVEYYNQVFDYVSLVCSERFVDKIDLIISPWWGLKIASPNSECGVDIIQVRAPGENESINPHSLVQLLWREEALEILKCYGLDKGVRSKPKRDIWKKLVTEMDITNLKSEVRACLKARQHWRADLLQK